MRLLVSVRDAREASAALAGGADIIDAKEPGDGPLAPVAPHVLQAICAAVPLSSPLSVALGDSGPAELAAVVSAVAPLRRRRELYFKAAVHGPASAGAIEAISAARRCLASRADAPSLIVARYVDAPEAIHDLRAWVDACATAGARGLLLDTSVKDGQSLPATSGGSALSALRRHAHRRGIWLAIAGGVTPADMPLLAEVRPDVVGVRGSACDGGRAGELSAVRVASLRDALRRVSLRRRPPALPV